MRIKLDWERTRSRGSAGARPREGREGALPLGVGARWEQEGGGARGVAWGEQVPATEGGGVTGKVRGGAGVGVGESVGAKRQRRSGAKVQGKAVPLHTKRQRRLSRRRRTRLFKSRGLLLRPPPPKCSNLRARWSTGHRRNARCWEQRQMTSASCLSRMIRKGGARRLTFFPLRLPPTRRGCLDSWTGRESDSVARRGR